MIKIYAVMESEGDSFSDVSYEIHSSFVNEVDAKYFCEVMNKMSHALSDAENKLSVIQSEWHKNNKEDYYHNRSKYSQGYSEFIDKTAAELGIIKEGEKYTYRKQFKMYDYKEIGLEGMWKYRGCNFEYYTDDLEVYLESKGDDDGDE